jgi:hypothetical protein
MGLDLSSNSGSNGGGGGGLARRTARMQLDPLLRRASLGVGDDAMEEADAKLEERERAVAEWRESLLPNPVRTGMHGPNAFLT